MKKVKNTLLCAAATHENFGEQTEACVPQQVAAAPAHVTHSLYRKTFAWRVSLWAYNPILTTTRAVYCAPRAAARPRSRMRRPADTLCDDDWPWLDAPTQNAGMAHTTSRRACASTHTQRLKADGRARIHITGTHITGVSMCGGTSAPQTLLCSPRAPRRPPPLGAALRAVCCPAGRCP